MSLGISLRGTLPKKGIFGRLSASEAFDRIAEVVQGEARTWVSQTRGTPWMHVNLHPATEDLSFRVEGADLQFSTVTSGAGPGYHQYLVSLLEQIAEKIGFEWQNLDRENEPGDETGYWEHRDRAMLEEEFLNWLGTLLQVVLGKATEISDFHCALAMPLNPRFKPLDTIHTSLGPRSLDWAREALLNPERAKEFWSWWDEGKTAQTWLNRAKVILWCEHAWCDPRSDWEASLIKDVQDSLDKAVEHGARDLPLIAWQSLGSTPPEGLVESHPEPFGYRRQPLVNSFGLGWSAELPGDARLDESDPSGLTMLVGQDLWEAKVFLQFSVEIAEQSISRSMPNATRSEIPTKFGKGILLAGSSHAHFIAEHEKTGILMTIPLPEGGSVEELGALLAKVGHQPPPTR